MLYKQYAPVTTHRIALAGGRSMLTLHLIGPTTKSIS